MFALYGSLVLVEVRYGFLQACSVVSEIIISLLVEVYTEGF